MFELRKMFAPEFLNRIDDVIFFNNLQRLDIHRIIDIELKGLFGRLSEHGIEVIVDDKAKDLIMVHGWDEFLGERPLRRAIMQWIGDPLADAIVMSEILPIEHILITSEDGEIIISHSHLDGITHSPQKTHC